MQTKRLGLHFADKLFSETIECDSKALRLRKTNVSCDKQLEKRNDMRPNFFLILFFVLHSLENILKFEHSNGLHTSVLVFLFVKSTYYAFTKHDVPLREKIAYLLHL